MAIAGVLCTAAGAAPATGPAAGQQPSERQKPDEAFLQAQRRQRDATRTQFAALRQIGPVSPDAACRVTLEHRLLHVETTPLAGPEQVRLRVEGSDAVWVASRHPAPAAVGGANAPNPGPSLTLQRFEPDARRDQDVWGIRLAANNQSLSLSGLTVLGRVMYTQNAPNPVPVGFSVMEWTAGPRMATVFSATATTFQQLRAEHPAEVRQYLLPLLAKLSDMSWMLPDAADVYRAFPGIPADPAVTEQVLAMLPGLDAGPFATREAASRRLAATGRPGVLAALRLDPATLTQEQRGRLGQFVAGYRLREDLDPAAARKDPTFLADALEYPDPRVRAAAREALQAVLGKPIEFDASLTGDALTAAADAVRKQVAERAKTQPATQPVQP